MERVAVTGAAEFSGTASTKQLLAKAFVFHTTIGGRSAGDFLRLCEAPLRLNLTSARSLRRLSTKSAPRTIGVCHDSVCHRTDRSCWRNPVPDPHRAWRKGAHSIAAELSLFSREVKRKLCRKVERPVQSR